MSDAWQVTRLEKAQGERWPALRITDGVFTVSTTPPRGCATASAAAKSVAGFATHHASQLEAQAYTILADYEDARAAAQFAAWQQRRGEA